MTPDLVPIAKFRLGRIMTTPDARNSLTSSDLHTAIQRHQAGDWGDVDEHDRRANEHALIDGGRLWSVYHARNGIKFWLITEANRSASTILLPENY